MSDFQWVQKQSQNQYEAALLAQLKETENDKLRDLENHYNNQIAQGNPNPSPAIDRIHIDPVGRPAIGYGYDLKAHSASDFDTALKAVGHQGLTAGEMSVIDGFRASSTRTFTAGSGQSVTRVPTIQDVVALGVEVTAAQASSMLQNVVTSNEAALSSTLGTNPTTGQRVYDDLGPSVLRAQVADLYYNNPGLVGSGLRTALRNGDLASVYHEIVFRSNFNNKQTVNNVVTGDRFHGLHNRRYASGQAILGLLGNAPTNQVEALAATLFNNVSTYENYIRDLKDSRTLIPSTDLQKQGHLRNLQSDFTDVQSELISRGKVVALPQFNTAAYNSASTGSTELFSPNSTGAVALSSIASLVSKPEAVLSALNAINSPTVQSAPVVQAGQVLDLPGTVTSVGSAAQSLTASGNIGYLLVKDNNGNVHLSEYQTSDPALAGHVRIVNSNGTAVKGQPPIAIGNGATIKLDTNGQAEIFDGTASTSFDVAGNLLLDGFLHHFRNPIQLAGFGNGDGSGIPGELIQEDLNGDGIAEDVIAISAQDFVISSGELDLLASRNINTGEGTGISLSRVKVDPLTGRRKFEADIALVGKVEVTAIPDGRGGFFLYEKRPLPTGGKQLTVAHRSADGKTTPSHVVVKGGPGSPDQVFVKDGVRVDSIGEQNSDENGDPIGDIADLTLEYFQSIDVEKILFGNGTDLTGLGSHAGGAIGSTIGNYLGGGNPFLSVAASSVLSTVLQNVGEELDSHFGNSAPNVEGFSNFFDDFELNLSNIGVSTIASFIVPDFGDSIGADLAERLATHAVTEAGKALLQSVASIGAGANFNPVGVIANFFADRLASGLIEAETTGGSILGSIGSAVGGFFGAIGTFAGRIIGTFIGNFFGAGPSVGPNGGANVEVVDGQFAVHSHGVGNGLDPSVVINLGNTVANGLNALVDATGGTAVRNDTFQIGFNNEFGGFFFFHRGQLQTANDARDAVLRGTLTNIRTARIEGGNTFAKRALLTTPASGIEQLISNMQIAQDYRVYLDNKARIDAMVRAAPDSSLAAGWDLTIAKAQELNLDTASPLENYTRFGELAEQQGSDLSGVDLADLIIYRDGNRVEIGWAGDGDHGGLGPDDWAGLPNKVTITDFQSWNQGISRIYFDNGQEVLIDALLDAMAASGLLVEGSGQPALARDLIAQVGSGTFASGSPLDAAALSAAGIEDAAVASIQSTEALLNALSPDDTYRAGIIRTGNAVAVAAALDAIANADPTAPAPPAAPDAVATVNGTVHADLLGADTGVTALDGGEGNDALYGSSAVQQLKGGAGNDRLFGFAGADALEGGAGNDRLEGGAGDDLVLGGDGDDLLRGDTGVWAGTAISGNDNLDGGAGNDVLEGGAGFDTLAGGTGDDILKGGADDDLYTYRLGDGRDRVHDVAGGNTNLTEEAYTYYVTETVNVRVGSTGGNGEGHDINTSGAHWVTISGEDGYYARRVQVRVARTGYRWVEAAPGQTAGGATDVLQFAAGITLEDLLFQQDGDDLVIGIRTPEEAGTAFGDLANQVRITDWVRAQGRIEALRFADGSELDATAIVNRFGSDGVDTVRWFETAITSIDLMGADDTIHTGDGDDAIIGGSGNDTIHSGGGDDTLMGTEGADLLYGGAGSDVAAYDISNAAVNIDLAAGTASGGHAEGDVLTDVESVWGSAFNDRLTGDGGNNWLVGQSGDDSIDGGFGADILAGGAGNDVLAGGSNNDIYQFNLGDDKDIAHDQGLVEVAYSGTETYTATRWVTEQYWTNGENQGWQTRQVQQQYQATRAITRYELEAGDGGEDILLLGAGVGFDEVVIRRTGNDLQVGLIDPANGPAPDFAATPQAFNTLDDIITLKDWGLADNEIELVALANGTTISLPGLVQAFGIVDGSVVNLGAAMDAAFEGNFDGDIIVGTVQDDTITGSDGADAIVGGDGADTLNGGAGDDFIDGGAGNDVIDGGAGNDTLHGGQGDDSIAGGAGNDQISGGTGNDTIDGGAGSDSIDGGAGVDTVDHSSSTESVNVNLSDGTSVSASGDTDTLSNIENATGSGHDDTISGDAGVNALDGGAGNDTLSGGGGADQINGGDGTDTASYAGSGEGVNVNLETGATSGGDANGDTLSNIENVTGSGQGDTLTGDSGDNALAGAGGNDQIAGGAGNDTLNGGTEGDALAGGAGNDVYTFDFNYGPDSVVDEHLELFSWTEQEAYTAYRTEYYWVNSGEGGPVQHSRQVAYTAYRNIAHEEWRLVNAGGDTLRFGAGVAPENLMVRMESRPGATAADPNTVDLVIALRPDGSTAAFEDLTDRIVLSNWFDPNHRIETFEFADGTVLGVAQIVGLQTTDNADTLTWTETALDADGRDGNDRLTGGDFADTLAGSGGDDILTGAGGADTLSGGVGQDTLDGGDGDDILDGGSGVDTITSGSGADTIHFGLGSGLDTVMDGGNVDTVVLGETVDLANLTFARSGDALTLTVSADDVLTLNGYFLGAAHQTAFVDHQGTAVDVIVSLSGTAANDTLAGTTANDKILGLDGADTITADNGHDVLEGGAGADILKGGAGNDRLQGGLDGDVLEGGGGDDVYLFDLGDGQDQITDYFQDLVAETQQEAYTAYRSETYWQGGGEGGGSWQTRQVAYTAYRDVQVDVIREVDAGLDTLRFGANIALADLSLRLDNGDLEIVIGTNTGPGADSVRISDWLDQKNRIERLELADGTSLALPELIDTLSAPADGTAFSFTDLMATSNAPLSSSMGVANVSGQSFTGTASDEHLVGTANTDLFSAGDGNNTISAGAGDDVIVTTSGSVNAIDGGVGDDVVTFAGNFADYAITSGADGAVIVSDATTSAVHSTLVDVERLQFADAIRYTDGRNDAPVASADTAETAEDTAITIAAADLLGNDTDANADILTVTTVGNAVNGAVELNQDGNILFTPDANFNGTATFDYTVSDGRSVNATHVASVAVTVTAVSDAPVLADDTFATDEDTGVEISIAGLLANDSDPDGDTLAFDGIVSALNGTAVDTGNGKILFTPNAEFSGDAGFVYRVLDGTGESAIADVLVNVSTVNDAPIAVDDVGTPIQENGSITLLAADLLQNDTDVDSSTLTITGTGNVIGGTVSENAQGDFLFTADAGFAGTASFEYALSDGSTGTDVGRVEIAVAAVDNVEAGTNGADTLFGGAGNDTLSGALGDDTLIGGIGNDVLSGGAGSDTYLFSNGDGSDTILSDGADGASTDTLTFQGSLASDDLWFRQSGTDLHIDILNSDDSVTIRNWFDPASGDPVSADQAAVDRIEAGGEVLIQANVNQLINAMAAFTGPAANADGVESMPTDTNLETTLAAAWTPIP